MPTRVDVSILHEIVRVIQARGKVPERVHVLNREYQLMYLDDHRQRLEEAMRRNDHDRVNMLFGQLASKVKYQLIRRSTAVQKARPAKARPQTRAARSRTTRVTAKKRARSR